jgi:hypothetical protein
MTNGRSQAIEQSGGMRPLALQSHNQPIVRQFQINLALAIQNFLAEMRQHNPLRSKPPAVLRNPRVIQMRCHPRLEKTAFAEEQVHTLCVDQQILGPAGIS